MEERHDNRIRKEENIFLQQAKELSSQIKGKRKQKKKKPAENLIKSGTDP